MFYWLFYEKLFHLYSPFREFQYYTFRTAMASLTALLLSIALGPWLIARLRAFQIGQFIREDGPEIASEKSRHADHGRTADLHVDRGADAAVGESARSGVVGGAGRPGDFRRGRVLGRLRESRAQTKSGTDCAREDDAADRGAALLIGALLLGMSAHGQYTHQHERSVRRRISSRIC